MKNLLAAITFLSGFSAMALPLWEGTRGGGDDVGIDFKSTAQNVADEICVTHETSFMGVDVKAFYKTAMTFKVTVVDTPLNLPVGEFNQQSAAENDPSQNLIIVNRARWAALTDDSEKRALALHELLSLMKVESTANYPISAEYLNEKKNFVQPALQLGPNAILADNNALQPASGFTFAETDKAFQAAAVPTMKQLAGQWKLIGLNLPAQYETTDIQEGFKYNGSGLKDMKGELIEISFKDTSSFFGSDELSVSLIHQGDLGVNEGPFVLNLDKTQASFSTYVYDKSAAKTLYDAEMKQQNPAYLPAAIVRKDAHFNQSCKILASGDKLLCSLTFHLDGDTSEANPTEFPFNNTVTNYYGYARE